MSDYIYSSPEAFGLSVLGEVEWRDEAYEFDLTVVWQHVETGALYMADDSGCSCPMPFEEHDSIDTLTPIGRIQDLIDHVDARHAELGEWVGEGQRTAAKRDAARLVAAAREAVR